MFSFDFFQRHSPPSQSDAVGSRSRSRSRGRGRGRIVSTADGGTYAYVMFAQIPAARRSVGARSKLGSVTVKAIGLDGVSATTTFPVIAIVEKDPPPPPKNVGKLVPKSLLAWRESRATTRGRVTIIDRDQAGAPT